MKTVHGTDRISGEICDALGLKGVITLDLHMSHNEMTIITVKMYAEENGIQGLIPIMKRFELVEKS